MTPWRPRTLDQRLKDLENQMATGHRSTQDDGWYCNQPDCVYGVHGVANFVSRARCNGCYKPRRVAQGQPPRQQARPAQRQLQPEQLAKDKEAKKREARSNKRAERAAARSAWKENAKRKALSQNAISPTTPTTPATHEPGPVATAMAAATSAPPPTTSKLRLSDATIAKVPLLLPEAIKVITDSLLLETIPTMTEMKNPETVMQKILGDRGPAAKVAKVLELQTSISALKVMLETSKSGGDNMSDLEQIMTTKLEAAESALLKAQRDAPSQLSELKAVQEAKSSHEASVQARKDQQQKGSDKAAERKALRHAHIKKLRDQLSALEADLAVLEDENNNAHSKRAAALAAVDAKVVDLFDIKIKSLQQQAAQAVQRQGPAPAQVQAQPPAPSTTAPLQICDTAATLAELEETKKKLIELQAKFQSEANAVMQQFEKSYADINPAMLPETKLPDPTHITAAGAVHEVLQNWAVAGAIDPFDWDTLDLAVGPSLEAVQVTKELVGGDLWPRWYPESQPLGPSVVPRQLALSSSTTASGTSSSCSRPRNRS